MESKIGMLEKEKIENKHYFIKKKGIDYAVAHRKFHDNGPDLVMLFDKKEKDELLRVEYNLKKDKGRYAATILNPEIIKNPLYSSFLHSEFEESIKERLGYDSTHKGIGKFNIVGLCARDIDPWLNLGFERFHPSNLIIDVLQGYSILKTHLIKYI
ncbi:hypothetical protein GF336_00520 [Candidatus Woesearchaeota archaeon]|nr:hypothetical protein [Candidatus Woesearchaeota archaeon]